MGARRSSLEPGLEAHQGRRSERQLHVAGRGLAADHHMARVEGELLDALGFAALDVRAPGVLPLVNVSV